ncbi:uncharacterized protein LOC131281450 [Anopheles ziemanni]|uniref:uncharacterized protein LOC131265333 n=1 Tax=Anopheles coustani TaxID=139045 RepID=UPI00265AC48A|nr:uncharacterized protein LOC131265333 [Anopheles coustani]XP_058166765.1 uncharacterized protein LOC131281450 [Anopheles ziemanni]
MDSERSENSSKGVIIEHNKDSPFQILDVRSISEVPTSFHYPPTFDDTGALSDDSSISERGLVIDMADEDAADMMETDKPNTTKLSMGERNDKRKLPPNVTVQPNRISRRKSQHVPITTDDVVFGVPIGAGPVVSAEDEMELKTCKNLVKLNVLLRSTINHVLEQRYDRNFNFNAARTDRSSFDQLRSWVNCYEKIKKESAAEKAQQEDPQVE